MTAADVAQMVAQASTAPWSDVVSALLKDPLASPTRPMSGPFAVVGRNTVNISPYRDDMVAAYRLTLRWLFTQDDTCAAQATKILHSWATTHTTWDANENYLEVSDRISYFVGAADLLRSAYAGWTDTHTSDCQAYVRTMFATQANIATGTLGLGAQLRAANQGTSMVKIAMAAAVFCEDPLYFRAAIDAFRCEPAGGLRNSLANGQVGDSGRDQGHSYGQIGNLLVAAEIAWCQGVDLYGELDNRLLVNQDYWARHNVGQDVPFITFGCGYGIYTSHGDSDLGGARIPLNLNIVANAYGLRKGLALPDGLTRYGAKIGSTQDSLSIQYLRSADSGTRALPLKDTAWTEPVPSALPSTTLSPLQMVDMGKVASAGTSQVADGRCTLTCSAAETETGFRFAFTSITGDWTFITRVLQSSVEGLMTANTGLMMRGALDASKSTPAVALRVIPGSGVQLFFRAGSAAVGSGNYFNYTTIAAPLWLKLVRRGNFIHPFVSPDGVNWSGLYTISFDGLSDLNHVGLFTSSGDASMTNTAVFDQVSIGTATDSRAAVPTGLTATVSGHQVQLNWTPSNGALAYNVARADASGTWTTLTTRLTGTSWVDTTAVTGVSYRYAIRAANCSGLSAAVISTPVSVAGNA
jgi:hypothetical protein